MTETTEQTNAELMVELNADLRARDPVNAMRQHIRLRTLDEVRVRISEQRRAGGMHAETYRQVEAILARLAESAPPSTS